MDNLFLEATNNIRVMHDIESILNNDDIPINSRSYLLQFLTESSKLKLTPQQQCNVNVFRDLFVRIDKDIRMFRTFLNIVVDLSSHFKFDNSALVYAFKNISLENHFNNFLDFARRKNPIIERNSPLQLLLSLGISLIKLALQKNHVEQKKKDIENRKKHLFSQYAELSRGMSRRFINLDFDITDTNTEQMDETYLKDLNNFNSDDMEEVESNIETIKTVITHTPDVHKESKEEDYYNIHDIDEMLADLGDDTSLPKYDYENEDDDTSDDHDTILKSLQNGDKELDLQQLDSLVMQAGKQFGPVVFNHLTSTDNLYNSEKPKPVVTFNNSVHNIVDFTINE